MILLLGANGYIGSQFATELRNKNVGFLPLSRVKYDYSKLDVLTDLIKDIQPNFLINCAGHTGKPNVDACEDNQWETFDGNAVLPETIAIACKKFSLPWGHVSSGCIYDGDNHGRGFTENDPPNLTFELDNCSYYSGTKVLGEENIKNIGGDYYIWRLRIPFDKYDGPRNYLSKLINYDKLLNAKNSISHRADFAKYCLELWEKECAYGIYNVVNTNPLTTKEVVHELKRKFKKDFSFFDNEEEFYSTAAKAKRSNCVLSNQKLIDSGVIVRTSLDAVRESIQGWTK